MKIYIIPSILFTIHLGYILTAIFYNSINKKKITTKKHHQGNYYEHTMEHIVCFKNESKFIRHKLENSYRLDYKHIHHTFVNDNSSDDTLELLDKFKNENTMIISNKKNLGKNQSQIKAVNATQSEMLIFTDSNVFLTKGSLKRLVQYLSEEDVGVCGNVTITTNLEDKDLSGKYWQIEKMLKKFQSSQGAVIGFDGGYYCVRRKNYNLTRENELSDFETAFLIFQQQKRCVYGENAIALELERRKIGASFKARIRASNRTFWSFYRISKYAREIKSIVKVHFFFHKLIRYLCTLTFVLSIPFLIYDMIKWSPLLLGVLIVPPVGRLILESVAIFVGGIVALSGKEYRVWSQKKV